MIGTEFRSDEVPAAEQFAYWGDRMRERMQGFRYREAPAAGEPAAGRPGFFAEELEVALGGVQLASRRLAPVDIHRRPGSRDDAEGYQLLVPLQGTLYADWDGRVTASRPGSVYFHDGTRLDGFGCRAPDGPGPDGHGLFHTAVIDLPKDQLPLPAHTLGRLVGRALPADEGTGALLTGVVTQLLGSTATYRPSDTPRLGSAVLGLVHAHLAHLLEAKAEEWAEPDSARYGLLLRVTDFVRLHLGDPELTPSTVAAAHHISVRYLHRIFHLHTEGRETVAGWIRRQRLEHARRDLADPALAAVPVHRIAARWGFGHAAVFTRTFRAAYGVPPREYRQQAAHPAR